MERLEREWRTRHIMHAQGKAPPVILLLVRGRETTDQASAPYNFQESLRDGLYAER